MTFNMCCTAAADPGGAATAGLAFFFWMQAAGSTERAKARVWRLASIDYGSEVVDNTIAMLLGACLTP